MTSLVLMLFLSEDRNGLHYVVPYVELPPETETYDGGGVQGRTDQELPHPAPGSSEERRGSTAAQRYSLRLV